MAHGRMGERPCAWRRRGGSPRAKIQHFAGHPKQRPGHQNRPRGGAGHRVFRPCAHGPWPLVVYYYIITPLFYIIILFYVFSTVRFYSAPCGIILHRAELFRMDPMAPYGWPHFALPKDVQRSTLSRTDLQSLNSAYIS